MLFFIDILAQYKWSLLVQYFTQHSESQKVSFITNNHLTFAKKPLCTCITNYYKLQTIRSKMDDLLSRLCISVVQLSNSYLTPYVYFIIFNLMFTYCSIQRILLDNLENGARKIMQHDRTDVKLFDCWINCFKCCCIIVLSVYNARPYAQTTIFLIWFVKMLSKCAISSLIRINLLLLRIWTDERLSKYCGKREFWF